MKNILFKTKEYGEAIPKYYGLAWHDSARAITYVMPIPLNVIAAFIRDIKWWMKATHYKWKTDRFTPTTPRKHNIESLTPFSKHRWQYKFDNGYGASVIIGPWSYGGDEGRFELAVTHGGRLCYSTPITDDVIGHLTFHEVVQLLEKIKALPKR